GLAGAAELGALWYKDESRRFGLGSFKSLGGAYAVFRALEARIRSALEAGELRPVDGTDAGRRLTGRSYVSGRPRGEHRHPSPGRELVVSSDQLRAGAYREFLSGVTVSCASAGNHGRSVAWGAEQFGCDCVIYVPAGTSEARAEAIAGHGARVVRVDGGYDRALERASRDAREEGRVLVSDTAYDGHTEIPRIVMQGYTVLVSEALAQLPAGSRPTHVFVQAGVGGLAAAVTAHTWEAVGPGRPAVVVVEAADADCLRRGVREGRRVELEAVPETGMGGLACRVPSRLAWPVLRRGAEYFMAVTDDAAHAAMRLLADASAGGDPGLVAGPSGAAGLAGLLSARGDAAASERIGLGPDARVLVVGTEGALDPAEYRRVVGRDPGEVRTGS
ncbi:MAG: diaminopropionate ammonia-lyase, partial [Gemmatimonadota bacterium]